MNKKLVFFAGSLLLLAGCSSVTVRRDYDSSLDFSTLKTFAWQHAEQPKIGNSRIDNDLLDERIRKAVDDILAKKGFIRVDSTEADFLIVYYRDYRSRLGGSSVSVGMGGGSSGRYGGVGYNSDVSEYDQAILTIDVLNPADEKLIWRGVGTRIAYDGSSPKKMTRIVNEAVAKILKKFPPKK
jgi:hypothetical protein